MKFIIWFKRYHAYKKLSRRCNTFKSKVSCYLENGDKVTKIYQLFGLYQYCIQAGRVKFHLLIQTVTSTLKPTPMIRSETNMPPHPWRGHNNIILTLSGEFDRIVTVDGFSFFSIGHFQFNQIPLPILNMNKIICFVGSFSKLYSQCLFSAYTSCIHGHHLRLRGLLCHQMDDITVKRFSYENAFSTVNL